MLCTIARKLVRTFSLAVSHPSRNLLWAHSLLLSSGLSDLASQQLLTGIACAVCALSIVSLILAIKGFITDIRIYWVGRRTPHHHPTHNTPAHSLFLTPLLNHQVDKKAIQRDTHGNQSTRRLSRMGRHQTIRQNGFL